MTTPQETIQQCSFWGLPEETRTAIFNAAPEVNTQTLELERNEDGTWQFDCKELLTVGELLVGGTEQIIDYHYQLLHNIEPTTNDSMSVTVSNQPIEDGTTELVLVRKDELMQGAGYYIDTTSQQPGWLCPWVRCIWNKTPEIIFVKCELSKTK